MKSLKYLLLMAACMSILTGTVFSQSLTRLKPVELNNIAAFYEWALEAKFTPERRQQLQQALEEELNENPKRARENLNIVLTGWEQIKQGSEEMRRQARAEFLPGYLAELRKEADPKHRFLLDIYKAEHDGRETFTSLDAARGNVMDKTDLHAASGDGPFASIAGKWQRHTGSGSITDGTGKTKYGNGTTFSFEFSADGSMTYRVVEKTLSIMGCKIESDGKAAGKFTLSGSTLGIALGAGTEIGSDSCSKSGNYSKALPAANLSVKYQIKQSDDVTRPDRPILLCMDGGDGEACFERIPRS